MEQGSLAVPEAHAQAAARSAPSRPPVSRPDVTEGTTQGKVLECNRAADRDLPSDSSTLEHSAAGVPAAGTILAPCLGLCLTHIFRCNTNTLQATQAELPN